MKDYDDLTVRLRAAGEALKAGHEDRFIEHVTQMPRWFRYLVVAAVGLALIVAWTRDGIRWVLTPFRNR